MKRLLCIDALSQYYRAYIVDPSLSIKGQPIGGVKGFLKILQKLMRETRPEQILIVWDGQGGSKKRKQFNKNYKDGRKPIRLNRFMELSAEEEYQNKIWQQGRLIEYLNQLPIAQLMIDNVEADDVISFIVNLQSFSDWQKVIVSSDKDFYQLCNDNKTLLFRPIQDEILSEKRICEQFGIHPNNFALARAMSGDKSDNLPGVPGVGLKTVAKRFPFLKENKSFLLKDVLVSCRKEEEQETKLRVYKDVLVNERLIKGNYKIMQLYAPLLSYQSKQRVKKIISECCMEFNKTEIIKMMFKDGMGELNLNDMFATMNKIVVENLNAK